MANQIKVAMLTRNFPPNIGGIATHASNLATNLVKLGVEVDIFRGDGDSRTAAMAALRSLQTDDYDILHVQSLPYGALTHFRPLVVTVHSPVLEEAKYYTRANKTKVPIAVLFEKLALRKADTIIVVSRTTVSQLEEFYHVNSNKLTLIPNGVDCERFNPKLKSWGEETRIIMCSRLEPRKNIYEGISALSTLKSEQFRVEIIGDGPERQELERKAAATGKPIFFLGVLPQRDLETRFSKANIFVSTSHSEGFGLSILQAMASGCAVVASDIPSHRELIVHGQEGLLYSTKSQLADSIKHLHHNKDFAKELGRKAMEKAQEYSWGKVANATLEVYRKLLLKQ